MPSDPYAKYLEPPASASASGGADPYAKYLQPAPASAGAPASSEAAPDVGYGEALARTFAQGATGGLSDVAIGGASDAAGTSATITSQRARTEAGMDKLPWYVRYPVEGAGLIAGLGTGVGELGLGARAGLAVAEHAAPLVGEKIAARAAGAASGAVDTGIIGGVQGAAGAKDISDVPGDALKGATEGALTGGVVGGALGAGSKAGINTKAKTIPELQAEKDVALGKMNAQPIAPGEVRGAVESAYDTLKPGELSGVSKPFRDQIARMTNIVGGAKMGDLSAGDVESMQRNLWGVAGRGFAPVDNLAAGRINAKLDDLLADYQAAPAVADFKQAHARLSDAEAMKGLTINTAPNWAKAQLNKEGMLYGDAEKAALTKLASYADKPPTTGFWDTLKSQVAQTAQDKGLGYFGALGAHAGPVGALGVPLMQAVGKAGMQGLKGNAIQKALDEAGATLTTGLPSQAASGKIAQLLGSPKTRAAVLKALQTGGFAPSS